MFSTGGDHRPHCDRNTYDHQTQADAPFTFTICSYGELRPTRCSLRRDSGVYGVPAQLSHFAVEGVKVVFPGHHDAIAPWTCKKGGMPRGAVRVVPPGEEAYRPALCDPIGQPHAAAECLNRGSPRGRCAGRVRYALRAGTHCGLGLKIRGMEVPRQFSLLSAHRALPDSIRLLIRIFTFALGSGVPQPVWLLD